MLRINYFIQFCLLRIQSRSNKTKGNIKIALEQALKAKESILKNGENETDKTLAAFNELALVYIQSDLANLFKDSKQWEKSIETDKENIAKIKLWDETFLSRIEKTAADKERYLSSSYNNLSLTLISKKAWNGNAKRDTSIENFLEKLIFLNRQTNNLVYLATNYYNYAVYFEGMKDVSGRKSYLEKALEINRELENKSGILICASEFADVLLDEKKEPQKALKLATEALTVLRGYPEWGSSGNVYLIYSRALSINNRFEEAAMYFDSAQIFWENEMKSTFDKEITEMQTKYETAEKEKEIKF